MTIAHINSYINQHSNRFTFTYVGGLWTAQCVEFTVNAQSFENLVLRISLHE